MDLSYGSTVDGTTNETNAMRINDPNKIRNTAYFLCSLLFSNDELYLENNLKFHTVVCLYWLTLVTGDYPKLPVRDSGKSM